MVLVGLGALLVYGLIATIPAWGTEEHDVEQYLLGVPFLPVLAFLPIALRPPSATTRPGRHLVAAARRAPRPDAPTAVALHGPTARSERRSAPTGP